MKIITNTVFALLLLTTLRVYAVELGASTYLQYIDYQEFNPDGSSPDRETGFLPGIKLQASYKRHTLWASYAYGNINYDGQLQSGVPYSTRTNYILSSAGYEYAHKINRHPDMQILAGFGVYRWQRHVLPNNGIAGLNEVYAWQQLHAGLRYKPEAIFNLPLEASFSLVKTFNGSVDVNLKDYGYTSPQLDLGDEYGFQVRIKYYKDISDKLKLNVSLATTRREFGRSQSKTLSNGFNSISVVEPRSVSWYTRLGIELEYSL